MAAAASIPRATNISRNLLTPPGIKSLRSYLQSKLDVLRRAPILLISSEAGASSSHLKSVADSCQWVNFTLSKQFGMRTVPTTISSAFPTNDSLVQTLELMQRTGASSVVGVGSGAAMDLAKAVQANLSNNNGLEDQTNNTRLILVPTTYSGVIAAGASHSLFLDGDEETLVPLPLNHQQVLATPDGAGTSATVVATLDPQKYMEHLDDAKVDVLLYAVSAILLDAGSRKSTHPSLPILLQSTIDLISLRKNNNSDSEISTTNDQLLAAMIPSLTNLLYESAGLLSYGLSDGFLEEDNRSITIALGSSLIPTLFPETHPISFIASLVPGLCHYYSQQQHQQHDQQQQTENDGNDDSINDKLRTLVQQLQEQPSEGGMRPPPSLVTRDETLEGFSIPDMALSHIQSNQAVWKPQDVPDDMLMQVLQHSLKQ